MGKNTIHPIIYLREKDRSYFVGCIITHSNNQNYKNNIPLMSEHFETHDPDKNKCKVFYEIVFCEY